MLIEFALATDASPRRIDDLQPPVCRVNDEPSYVVREEAGHDKLGP